jgi:hypothetical protein
MTDEKQLVVLEQLGNLIHLKNYPEIIKKSEESILFF